MRAQQLATKDGAADTTEETDSGINEELFRYPGPKPSFKESALIALADSIEAASRSLKQAGVEDLNRLIDTIIRERMSEGQLDEAPLTFAELAKARESFADTLHNMLHGRVAYPKQ